MPAASYPYVEPVTDEKIDAMGELWNRDGEMTLRYGVKTAAHHEFWCGIRPRKKSTASTRRPTRATCSSASTRLST